MNPKLWRACGTGAALVVGTWLSSAGWSAEVAPTPQETAADAAYSPALFDPYGLDRNLSDNYRQPLQRLKLPWPDVLQTSLQRQGSPEFVVPQSDWHDSETKLFGELLASGQFDVLVVPFQTQHFGLDRIARSIMTADLAYALANAGSRVADPYLVARAFGDGLRTIPAGEPLELAQRLGSTKVIWGYVGHGRDGKLKLSIRTLERDSKAGIFTRASSKQRDWTDIPFTDQDPPEAVFHRMLAEIMDGAELPHSPSPAPSKVAPDAPFIIPDEPHALVAAGAESAISAAAALELLGALAPTDSPRLREILHERAWLALRDLPADDSFTRVLRARALHGLYRRPAALHALADDAAPVVVALRAILNGNLPEADSATSKIDDEYLRLLATLELADLRSAYQLKPASTLPAALAAVTQRSEQWQALLERRWRVNDVWAMEDNAAIKHLLDRDYPVPGLALDAMVTGQRVIGQDDTLQQEVQLSVVRHVRKVLASAPQIWCCKTPTAGIDERDYLWLLEALGEASLLKDVKRALYLQGLPRRALEMLGDYAGIYAGHPVFDSVHALAELRLADDLAPAERGPTLASMRRHATSALYWEQGQSLAARSAAVAMGLPSPDSSPFHDAYVRDFPTRSYWFTYEEADVDGVEHAAANTIAAIDYATADFTPVAKALNSTDQALRQRILQAIEGRFAGNSAATDVLAKQHMASGESSTVERTYRDAIRQQPEAWQNYAELGLYLIEDRGDYAAASALYESFPGFHVAQPDNSVALSNQSHVAGSLLYWRGALPEATTLYEISARYENGSDSSITSALRLDLLGGRYVEAARGSLLRANRYNSPYAYRDYLALLHVLGFSKAAWAGFAQLADKFQNPQVWLSALVGQQLAGLTAPEFKAWILRDEVRTASFRKDKLALGLALMWNLVDREPMPELAALLAEIEGEPLGFIDVDGRTLLKPHPMSDNGYAGYPPSQFRAPSRKPLAPDTKVPSGLILFADAYQYLKRGAYAEAVTRFDHLAERYIIESEEAEMSFALPYFAYASAKAGDPLGLAQFLATLPREQQRFDFHLAMALFAGLGGKLEPALDHLEHAFNRRPHTDARPVLTEYQYAEVCEWLLRESGAEQYRDLLLDWARKHQHMQPMFAWAYVLDARWSRTAEERARVLPMALYLDHESARLRELDAAELDAARARVGQDNPFLEAGKRLAEEAPEGA